MRTLRWTWPLLAALLMAGDDRAARAAPVDPAAICGSLHKADIQPLISPPHVVVHYRWHLISRNSGLLTVMLIVQYPHSRARYGGIQCQMTGETMTALPYRTQQPLP